MLSSGRIHNENICTYNEAIIFYKKISTNSPLIIKIKYNDEDNKIHLLDNKEIFSFYKYYNKVIDNNIERYDIWDKPIYFRQCY